MKCWRDCTESPDAIHWETPKLTQFLYLEQAIKFIEQGPVRVGPEVVTDPAFLVTRNLEDFVTWVDSSKIKRNILKYRDKLDDFDLL